MTGHLHPASCLRPKRRASRFSLGDLRLFSVRANARTKVVHALTGSDRRIMHQIEYRGVELEAFETKCFIPPPATTAGVPDPLRIRRRAADFSCTQAPVCAT